MERGEVKKKLHVHILTYCKEQSLIYGTELIFRTLRAGFPNAHITVTDNTSIASARERVKSLSEENDCLFKEIQGRALWHHDFIENTLRTYADDPSVNASLIFLDPDLCLWHDCEGFAFDGLIAGNLMGGFHDSITRTLTMPRLHTSFLWIPDPAALQNEIRKMRARHFDFEPFRPFSFRLRDIWYRYDTAAGLYMAMPDKVSIFADDHKACYDHIFSGSHINSLIPFYSDEVRELMQEVHSHARNGNLEALKGIHKYIDRTWWNLHDHIAL
jgi:hypothetical protein